MADRSQYTSAWRVMDTHVLPIDDERRMLKSGTEHTRAMIALGRYAEERTAPRRLAEAEAATLDAANTCGA